MPRSHGFRATALCVAVAWTWACGGGEPVAVAPEEAAQTFSFAPAAVPESASRGDADAVLVLPFVNRTPHPIHPSWLRAFDRTLAAHAAVFGGRTVVDPELAPAVAASLGLPGPGATSSGFVPDPAALLREARGAGAGTVIWGELRADGTAALHAAGASPAPWDGVVVELTGSRDLAFYEGPRRVLEALEETPLAAEAPPEPARQELAAILATRVSKGPAALRRAERALAELAARHPRWPEPWIELAWLDQERVILSLDRHDLYHPSVSRHVARLFALPPAKRARLDTVDWFLTFANRPSIPTRETLQAELPPTAWERAAAKWREAEGAPGWGLEHLEARTLDERALLMVADAVSDEELWEKLDALVANVDPATLLASPLTLRLLKSRYSGLGEWAQERGLSRILALHEGRAVVELLRGECLALPGDRRSDCEAPLVALFRAAGLSLDSTTLADAHVWADALDAWLEASSERQSGSDIAPLPDGKAFQDDPSFIAEWVVPAELIVSANAVTRAVAQTRRGRADVAGLLAAPGRRRLARHLDRMLEALHLPAVIQTKRGDNAAAWMYAQWGRRFEGFPAVRYWQAYIGERKNKLEAASAAYEKLARNDPYDPRWTGSWLYYVDYRENISWDDASSAREAEWLETWVPRSIFLTRQIVRAWKDANRPERALPVFASLEEQIGKPWMRGVQDPFLEALGRPLDERIARIEEGHQAFPHNVDLLKDLIALETKAGRYASAEARARTLLGRQGLLQWTCGQLAILRARQGRPEEGGEILADCARSAESRWNAAFLWSRYGRGLLDRDRFEEAAAAYRKSHELVGGAYYAVEGLGRAAELSGNFDEAQRQYEWLRDTYAGDDATLGAGRWELWQLHLRQDQPARARAEIERKTKRAWGNQHHWAKLRTTYEVEGNLGAFEEMTRDRSKPGPAYAYAEILSRRGKTEAALAIVRRLADEHPEQGYWRAYEAEFLVEADRPAEAVAPASRAYEMDPRDDWTVGVHVDVLIAAGDLERAEEVARRHASENPDWPQNVLPLAHVERARGRTEAARDIMERSRRRHPWAHDPWRAEVDWLPFEVSLGIPPRGSEALAGLEERIERALNRHPLEPELWTALATVREKSGDTAGAREAANRASVLAGRPVERENVAKR